MKAARVGNWGGTWYNKNMLSISNLLCDFDSGSERLRYGHRRDDRDGAPRPVVVWGVTRACNLRCIHCYASSGMETDPNELTFDEGIALLDDLKSFGVPAVLFSGGEPLARTDTPDLIGYATKIGLPSTLSTNGILIDDYMADRLANLGLKYAGISIDGIPSRHDKLRGMQGAFAASLASIERCQERGIKVGVRFTVHALNVDDLDMIFDICQTNKVQRLCIYHLAYAGRGANMQNLDLTHEQTRAVMDRIFERTREIFQNGGDLEVLTVDNHADAGYIISHLEKTDPQRAQTVYEKLAGTGGNRSGLSIASIDPTGNVHYDQFSWLYNCGNIRETPFSQIWGEPIDERIKLLRNRTQHLPSRCRECKFLDVCNGNLRTRAEYATGNWLDMDPGCYLTTAETTRPHNGF